MSDPRRIISKNEYFTRLDQGVPIGNCWVDMGNGEYVYVLHEVVVVGVPINKYNDRTFIPSNTYVCVADNTRVDTRLIDLNNLQSGTEIKSENEHVNSNLQQMESFDLETIEYAYMLFNSIGGVGSGMTEMGGSFRLTSGAKQGNKISIKHYESGWRGGSRAKITTYNAVKWGGRLSKGATGIGLAIGAGQVVYEMYEDDWNYGYNAQHKTSEVAGGAVGAWTFAIAGAKGGAVIGVWFGGVGAPVGALIGGIIGGIAGGFGGAEAGGAIYRFFNK